MAIEDTEDLSGREDSKYIFDPATCVMWFAGKKMERDEIISKYCGKNEKCMVKCKLTSKGGSAPQRAPAVDEDTQYVICSLPVCGWCCLFLVKQMDLTGFTCVITCVHTLLLHNRKKMMSYWHKKQEQEKVGAESYLRTIKTKSNILCT